MARPFAARSVADLLRERQVDTRMRSLAQALRGFYLAEPTQLSSLVLLDELRNDDELGATEMSRVAGGNDRLAESLARSLGSRLLLQCEALRVRQDATGVRLTTRDRLGRQDQLSADYIVLAMPATLVRRLSFSPRLPDPQRRAYDTLRYGAATKTLLQFARPFWRRPNRPRAFGSDAPFGAVWDGSEGQRGASAILVALAGGDASAATQAILAHDGAAGLAARLDWLGGSRRDRTPIAAHVTTWEDDPWARGGYAYFDTAFDPALRRWLAAPAGRILFAGEHTSIAWQGYMEGAVESGERAALELLALAGRLMSG